MRCIAQVLVELLVCLELFALCRDVGAVQEFAFCHDVEKRSQPQELGWRLVALFEFLIVDDGRRGKILVKGKEKREERKRDVV